MKQRRLHYKRQVDLSDFTHLTPGLDNEIQFNPPPVQFAPCPVQFLSPFCAVGLGLGGADSNELAFEMTSDALSEDPERRCVQHCHHWTLSQLLTTLVPSRLNRREFLMISGHSPPDSSSNR